MRLHCVIGLIGATTIGMSQTGSWSPVFELPLNSIHTSLLPTGKVLMWGRIHENDIPIVFDPETKTFVTYPTPGVDIFCSGHTFLADGSLLVAGGHVGNDIGTKDLLSFDPFRLQWNRLADLTTDRWYSSTTNLADGRVLVSAETYTDSGSGAVLNRTVPEFYDPERNVVSAVPTASHKDFHYYPIIYTLTDGSLMLHRPVGGYRKLNPTSPTPKWSGSDTFDFKFEQKSSARFLPNKLLAVSSNKTSERRTIGLFDANALTWTRLSDSIGGRRDCDLTILADGKVLISGGSQESATPSTCTNDVELFDPVTNSITVDARASIPRTYHSSAVLLPDGSVLKVGSGSGGTIYNIRQKNGEIYYPPYFFKGERPVISSAPEAISYGATVNLTLTTTKRMKEAALIRLGSATHAMNFSQYYIPLALKTQDAVATNSFVMTKSTGDAPPGPYMLVVVNEAGVPSIAKMVTVGTDLPRPLLTSFTPASGTTVTNVTDDAIKASDSHVATVAIPNNTINAETNVGDFEFTLTKRFISSLRLRVTTRWAMGGKVRAELWNNYTGTWELMGEAAAGQNGQQNLFTNYFTRRLNAREYVDQTTKKARVRLTFKNPITTRTLSNPELDMLGFYITY